MAQPTADSVGVDAHPTAAELQAFAVGRLGDDRLAAVAEHVERCEHCAAGLRAAPDDDLVTRLRITRSAAATGANTPFDPPQPQNLQGPLAPGASLLGTPTPHARSPVGGMVSPSPPFGASVPGPFGTPAGPFSAGATVQTPRPQGTAAMTPVPVQPVRPTAVIPRVVNGVPQLTGMHPPTVPGAPGVPGAPAVPFAGTHAGGAYGGRTQSVRAPGAETNVGSGGSRFVESIEHTIPLELAEHPRYEILSMLGAGGMGVVYKARHRMMERLVALKVMAQHLFLDPQAVGRFQREVKAAAALKHTNIVTAFDAEQAGALHFLVTEFIEGESLEQVVERGGPLSVLRTAEYGMQAALGLQHAQEQGMVHRDIKPQNLMLTPQGQIKILDFGLARMRSEGTTGLSGMMPTSAAPAASAAGLTRNDIVLGTPDYIAPEQAGNSRNVDTRADIYSLGCTLYYMLTGGPPFPDGSTWTKLSAHINREPQRLNEFRRDLPKGFEAVVQKMMEKDPQRRYRTPADVAAALKPFTTADKPHASGLAFAAWPEPWKNAAAVGGALAAGALLAFALWPRPQHPDFRDPRTVAQTDGGKTQENQPNKGNVSPTANTGSAPSATVTSPPAPADTEPEGRGSLIPPLPPAAAPLLPPREVVRGFLRGLTDGASEKILPPPPAGEAPQGNPPMGNAGAGERSSNPPGANGPRPGGPPRLLDDPRVDSGEQRPRPAPPKYLLIVPSKDIWYFDYQPIRAEMMKAPHAEVVTAGVKRGTARYMPGEQTLNGRTTKAPHTTATVTIQRELSQINMEDFAAVVFIGADVSEFIDDGPGAKETERILKDAWRLTRPIASICVSTKILAKHGFLRDLPAARGKLLPPGSVNEDDARWEYSQRFVLAAERQPSTIFTAASDADAYQLAHELMRFYHDKQGEGGSEGQGGQGGQNGPPRPGFPPRRPGAPPNGGFPKGPQRNMPR